MPTTSTRVSPISISTDRPGTSAPTFRAGIPAATPTPTSTRSSANLLVATDPVAQRRWLVRLQRATNEDLFGLWFGFPRDLVLVAPERPGLPAKQNVADLGYPQTLADRNATLRQLQKRGGSFDAGDQFAVSRRPHEGRRDVRRRHLRGDRQRPQRDDRSADRRRPRRGRVRNRHAGIGRLQRFDRRLDRRRARVGGLFDLRVRRRRPHSTGRAIPDQSLASCSARSDMPTHLGCLFVVGFIPFIGGTVALVAFFWWIAASIYALKQSLDSDWTRAGTVGLIALIPFAIVMLLFYWIFGILTTGPRLTVSPRPPVHMSIVPSSFGSVGRPACEPGVPTPSSAKTSRYPSSIRMSAPRALVASSSQAQESTTGRSRGISSIRSSRSSTGIRSDPGIRRPLAS